MIYMYMYSSMLVGRLTSMHWWYIQFTPASFFWKAFSSVCNHFSYQYTYCFIELLLYRLFKNTVA